MFDILLAIKYINMRFFGIKMQYKFKDQYIFQNNGPQLNGNGLYINSTASIIIKFQLLYTLCM